MQREKIEKIMDEIEKLEKFSGNDEEVALIETAIYIYIRYGRYEFDNYITDKDLEDIYKLVYNASSLFNEGLNQLTADIIYNKELEED